MEPADQIGHFFGKGLLVQAVLRKTAVAKKGTAQFSSTYQNSIVGIGVAEKGFDV